MPTSFNPPSRMSHPAIQVEKISKSFSINRFQGNQYKTLREELLSIPRQIFGRKKASDNKECLMALKDISFEVERGEVLGIIGRNGAGKSTLLKVLSRIIEPTSGRATIYGRVGSLLEVGTGFHRELTGRENIFLNGTILGMRKAEVAAKFDEILAFSGVEQFVDTPVKHYSSGMYMRLAFAVAAHLEPEILVVDEVLAVGDAEFQKRCLGKMGEVAKSGRTVLFVSHNMNGVEQLCTRALLLKKGVMAKHSSDVRSVIKEHLFGSSDQEPTTEWVNSSGEFQNPWFQPTRFVLTDEHGNKAGVPLSSNAEVWIQLEGEVRQLDPALTVGYALYSEEGHLLYWSYQTDLAEDQWPKIEIGRNVLRSQIPKRLLNDGTFRLELICSLHCRQWLLEPGVTAPSVFFSIQGGLSDSPLWMLRRPGILAPNLRWEKT